jgi:hypothetical protein
MDLSGPDIDVKLKERKKERKQNKKNDVSLMQREEFLEQNKKIRKKQGLKKTRNHGKTSEKNNETLLYL